MTLIWLLIISYLLGSIPTALIVGKLGYGVDIRTLGSGNLGGTNTFRSLGFTAGLIVTVIDVLKGSIAAALPYTMGVDINPMLAGLPAVLGHCYPIFAGFRGGKAVATSAGVLLLYSPFCFIAAASTFFITMYLSKYVSLASIIAAIIAHTYAIFFGDKVLSIVTFALVVFLLWRHRSNIERILNGTERKISWM
ncbi:glycerol-3-phosphate 1-O-acyltransferase PlsY [Tumebacillus algifaecis]